MAIVTLYYKGNKNKPMQVSSGDASYWKKQGWTTSSSSGYSRGSSSGSYRSSSRGSSGSRSSSSYKQSTSQVNALYQKYFGRDAKSNEINFWRKQSRSALKAQLKKDYKKATGIDYDGSSIKENVKGTDNQFKEQSQHRGIQIPTNFKTAYKDVVANFSKYKGREPYTKEDWKNVAYLMKLSPQEVESRLKGDITISSQTTSDKTNATEYDPYKEAAKYGYSRSDFANDPGFADYWKNKTPEQLKAELMRRGDFDIKSGTKVKDDQQIADEGLTDEQKAAQQEGHNWIDGMLNNGEISEGQALILHEIFSGDYTSGQKIPSVQELQGIIAQAATNAEIDLSPYYEKMEYRDMQDIKQSLADIRAEAAREAAKEKVSYRQKLAQAKQSLRQRGLTFSGASRQKLGAEGALQAEGVEGTMPTERRLDYEEKLADYRQRARDIGIAAERKWGTGVMTGIDESGKPINDQSWLAPYRQQQGQQSSQYRKQGAFGSVWTPQGQKSLKAPWLSDWQKAGDRRYEIGDAWLDKKKEIEKSKWDRVGKYRRY